MLVLARLVVSLGTVVIVPLGPGLVDLPGSTTVRRSWFVVAVPGVVSLWLDRGALSITLAGIYLAVPLGTGMLEWMVATYGLANAVGFALCGLPAWQRVKERVG